MSSIETTAANDRSVGPDPVPVGEVIEADSLVEEVSIDGMCGVY